MSQLDNTSPEHKALLHWRNLPQTTIDSLDDFLFWLEYGNGPDISEDDIKDIKHLVNLFLGDKKKIVQGERAMLAHWKQATIDTESK